MKRKLERLRLILKYKMFMDALLWRKKIYSIFSRNYEQSNVMVNIGGGMFFRRHWKVMDYSSPYYPYYRRFIDYHVDLCSDPRFPFEDESVSFFYSAHTFEHIPQEFCPNAFREIHRTLKPGGAVRLTMPDFDWYYESCKQGDAEFFSARMAEGFTIEEALVRSFATDLVDVPGKLNLPEARRNLEDMSAVELANHYMSRASREVQKENAGYHINWFNHDKLSTMLREAGFDKVYRSYSKGSRFEEMKRSDGILTIGDVLDSHELLDFDVGREDRSIYVEAVK